MLEREIYASPNGDRWVLVDSPDTPQVEHRANLASGGAVTRFLLSTFLGPNNHGPEHEALRTMLEEHRLKRASEV